MAGIRLANDTQRVAIVGETGSGKTVAGAWQLSERSYTTMPWLVYDFKGDELLNSIEGAQHIGTGDDIPTQPGLYIVHALPEDEAIDEQMMKIWAQQNVGVFVDEGYMVRPRSKPFQYLLTQGRSRHIPMIILSQRPVFLNRFVFTEADFIQIFHLGSKDDLKKVQDYIPSRFDLVEQAEQAELPFYYSWYYDKARRDIKTLAPVPDGDAILSTFDMRLRTLNRVT